MSNLAKRSISGFFFIVVVLASLLSPLSFALVFAVFTGLALHEFCRLVNQCKGANVNALVATVAGVYLFLATTLYCGGLVGVIVFAPYLLSLMFLPLCELYLRRPSPLNDWAYAFAAQIYIALPFSLLAVLAFHTEGFYSLPVYSGTFLLALFVLIWLNDSGAYLFGSRLQRYWPAKLFERISPHKSWVGSLGGCLVTVGASLVFAHFCPQLSVGGWIGFALTVVVFGTWGDLTESLIKRELGVKDSGRFLPGHGGVLDRFDSLLLAAPAVVIYLSLVLHL